MFKRSVLVSLLSTVAVAAAGAACSSASTSSPMTGNDSGLKSDSSLGGQDSGPPVDSGTADSTVADTNANDSGIVTTDTGTVTDTGTTTTDSGEPGDSGTGNDSGTTVTDSAVMDSAIPVMPPSGTPIATGDNLQIWGITGDNFIIYSDETAGILYAIPVAGGAVKTITSSFGAGAPADGGTSTHSAGVQGNLVFIWTGLDAVGAGAMSLWTSAAAAPSIVSANTLSNFAIVTADSSHVAYFDNIDETNAVGDFFEASATGTGKTSLVAAVDLSQQNCTVTGNVGASAYFVLNHCELAAGDAGADASAPPTFLSEFLVTTGHRTDLLSTTDVDTSTFVVNPTGTEVLVVGDPGLELFTLAATPPTGKLIDANAAGEVVFTPDGLSAIYETGTPTMMRSLLSTPAPTTLQGTFLGFYGVSADGTHVLGFENFDPTFQTNDTDLFLASATIANTPRSLVAGTTALAGPSNIGDSFTTDSSHALFVDQSTAIPTLNAVAVGAGGPTVLAQNPLFVLGTGTSSSVVLFSNNPFASALSNGLGTADMYTVDTGMAAAPTLLVSQANASFGLTTARDKIAYVWDVQAGPKAGLYVSTLP